MHHEVSTFIRAVKKHMPHRFRLRSVLEVGSHNINGSPRKFFWLCKYTGVDIGRGKGVDIVGRLSDIIFSGQYEVVISTEMLEHDRQWQYSLAKMYQLLQPGGMLIITCAGPRRKEHGTARTTPGCSPDTNDYYRNISTADFERVLPDHLFSEYVLQYSRGENDLQFYGVKNGAAGIAGAGRVVSLLWNTSN